MFTMTVKQNKLKYTKKHIQIAEKAMMLYGTMARPRFKDFIGMLAKGHLKSFDLIAQDAKMLSTFLLRMKGL